MVKGKSPAAKKATPKTAKAQPARPSPSKGRASAPAKAGSAVARSASAAAPRTGSSTARKVPAAPKAVPPLQEKLNLLSQEKNELQNIMRRLKAERDSALAEATRLEERVRELEKASSRQAARTPQPAGPGEFDPSIDLEEEGGSGSEDELEGAAGFFDRIEELRARRIELDRERNDREMEQSEQSFWLICPKCGDSMDEQESENVKLERCDNCGGLYLDRGEVDLLLSLTTDRDGLRRIHNILKF